MNGAPDWQDGDLCFRCRTQFTLVARKHHCRNCGNIFCAKCSSQQIPLPKLNIEKNVRVCDTCYEKIASKNEDPLALALEPKDKEQTKAKASNSNSKSSSSNNSKPAASASAPSEQELKEEEEFQLALALSLSETPTKVSFPDCQHFEEPNKAISKNPALTSSVNNNNGNRPPQASAENGLVRSNYFQSDMVIESPVTKNDKSLSNNSYPSVQQQPVHQQQTLQAQPQQTTTSQGAVIDYQIQDRDREVFKFVGEVQSTLEVFTNRLESCKLRNRPISNEAAIQSQFLRLNTEIQPKLAEYIRSYDEERADYERLQDKLSQIADARAALDALREEHQEKMRQQAAEADRLRQTQLATKLEAMRQKKSQMMQYQRELALQRIREQEMAMQQAQQLPAANQSYQVPSVPGQQQAMLSHQVVDHMQLGHQMQNTSHQPLEELAMHQDWTQSNQQHQVPDERYTSIPHTSYTPAQQIYQSQQIAVQPPSTTQVTHVPQQQSYVVSSAPAQAPAPQQQQPVIDRASIAQLERQFLPDTKPEEDAPLISFDD